MSGLLDLTTVKAAIQPPVTVSTDDTNIQRMIDAVSAWFERETGVPVLADGYVEQHDGPGGPRLLLRRRPIQSVASVLIGALDVPPADGTTGAGFTWTTYSVVLRGYVFTPGVRNVEVAYTAGYDDVPADIQQFVVDAVTLAYKRAPHLDYQSKQLAGEVITFLRGAMPPSSLKVMAGYKRGLTT